MMQRTLAESLASSHQTNQSSSSGSGKSTVVQLLLGLSLYVETVMVAIDERDLPFLTLAIVGFGLITILMTVSYFTSVMSILSVSVLYLTVLIRQLNCN
jgi:Ca2+/Na+ antiporter